MCGNKYNKINVTKPTWKKSFSESPTGIQPMTSPDCWLECSTTELRETQVVSKVILVGGVIGHASRKAQLQQCARHTYNDLHRASTGRHSQMRPELVYLPII